MPQETRDLIHLCIAEKPRGRARVPVSALEVLAETYISKCPSPRPGAECHGAFVQEDVVYSTMLGSDPFHVDQGSLRSKLSCATAYGR